MEKKFSLAFSLIVIAELICTSYDSLMVYHYITKPAIVGMLLVFFWKQSAHLDKGVRHLTLVALIASWIGDILLIFETWHPELFMFGLIAFLIAHMFYILLFLKHRNRHKNPLVFIGLLLIYAGCLFYILKDGLNDMLIPVIVYMLVILGMSTTAFLRQGSVPKQSFLLVFAGAILFMISDSILALNKFYEPLVYSNISIMTTYALAQFLIVIGILKLTKKQR
ncbi:lysoplasmalogenase [Psychroserpens sp. SPM9]|uniref:lysoplasmalogenase n=1 Tax=Psychroserpens sp. SPM9 TaxID=2975598 RepID=UPI0021A822E0|nr:lysoplasmalogenase [Psychroserpens sp. SPM9]MDG5492976.1 lysoplasmalogenase [Psychroserpens sp. SPM9]